ncbi:DnaD domain-containing protein [Pueribacillus sp. YX66]|uniref:DnaD domain-containing protein n=1 Tax=Pueribacillus sp. YX66 TaxID=3229242 RepID=UPI00358D53F5
MKKELLEKWFNEGAISIPNLLLQHYKQIDMNEIECMLIIQIYSFISKGIHFPTPDQLSERMTLSSEDCMQLVRTLIQKDVLLIEEHKEPYSESYSLSPLWKKLSAFIVNNEKKIEATIAEENLYTLFENEFARPLSPIECETLAMWIDEDKHSTELIKAALKESVLSGKLNFRYIDRILFEWKKNGIKTVEEAHTYGERFRRQPQRQTQEKEVKSNISYPFYNWL